MNKLSIKKEKVYSLLVSVISVLLSLYAVEVIVRIFFPQPEAVRWLMPDETYGHVLKKNFHQKYRYVGSDYVMDVKTNSLGLRDKEYDLLEFAKSDVKKVLLIGDSFTFGYGVNVEDNFDAKLEELLNQSEEKFIVINTGVGGWGTLQETTYARDRFDLFNPDIIILTFCGNDPGDDVVFKDRINYRPKGYIPFFASVKIFLGDHLHLYRFVYYKFGALMQNSALKKRAAESDQNVEIDRQSASLVIEDEWDRTFKYIKSFHRDFLKFNPNGVLLLQAAAPWDTNHRERLSSLSNGENLIYVDLYDDTISLTPEQRRLPHDGHWSQLVHSISAKKLSEVILEPDSQ